MFFYYNIGFLTFTNANINEDLPKPITENDSQDITITGSIDNATNLDLGFELVGIRGNDPDSTIILLEKDNYCLLYTSPSPRD